MLSSINLGYILCVFNPATYRARKPNLGYKTSIVSASTTYNVVTNASGNGAVYVFS